MHLCRVQICNFRNFTALDVVLNANMVMVGENRVGKSNFIFALRLVLDASLPDSVRQLKLTDFCDELDIKDEPQIEIHLDFTGFDGDLALTALLTDYRLADNHEVARLSYIYRKKLKYKTLLNLKVILNSKFMGEEMKREELRWTYADEFVSMSCLP